MSQTTTPQIDMTRAFSGMAADGFAQKDVVTGKLVASALVLGRLAVVDQANGEGAVKAPGATLDVTNLSSGIVTHAHALESSGSGDPQWPINSAAPITRRGRVYCDVEDAVTDGDPVFARHHPT